MTAEPLELLTADLGPGEGLRDLGMAQVTDASDPDDVAKVDRAIARWAASGREFSANDLRSEVHGVRPALWGARFHAAKKAGVIRSTGGYVRSSLPSTRSHVIALWVGA